MLQNCVLFCVKDRCRFCSGNYYTVCYGTDCLPLCTVEHTEKLTSESLVDDIS